MTYKHEKKGLNVPNYWPFDIWNVILMSTIAVQVHWHSTKEATRKSCQNDDTM